MRKQLTLMAAVVLLLLFSVLPATTAQEATPELSSIGGTPGVDIAWPIPVSEVWTTIAILGTADVQNMAYYYLEYLPLNDDLSFPEGAPWLPATVASDRPVDNGVLAVLDTSKVTDGVYALRLVVALQNNQTLTDTVTPIRVNNARYHQEIEAMIAQAIANAGVQPTPTLVPTVAPTAAPAAGPTVTPLPSESSVNVRRCDVVDNYSCAIVGYLQRGQTAAVVGISSNGSGWYQVQLPSGTVGWVSPTVVSVSGDMSGVPSVTPPAPLPPPATANITVNGISISGTPTCGVAFNVNVNVANTGNATSGTGTVTVQDVNVATGEITFTGYGNYPAIPAGGNYVVVVPVTTTVYYNQQHQLNAYVGTQTVSTQYTLAQGNCNVAPTPPQPQTYSINDSNNGGTVTMRVGDTLVVTLNANVTTGYSWIPTGVPSQLQMLGSPTTLPSSDQLGAGGQQVFNFRAVASGSGSLSFSYQPAGGGATEQSFVVTVNVS